MGRPGPTPSGGSSMELLSTAARCVHGVHWMSKWTHKRGPHTFHKSRSAKDTGFHAHDGKFVPVKEMVPELVVPELAGWFQAQALRELSCPPVTPTLQGGDGDCRPEGLQGLHL